MDFIPDTKNRGFRFDKQSFSPSLGHVSKPAATRNGVGAVIEPLTASADSLARVTPVVRHRFQSNVERPGHLLRFVVNHICMT